MPRLSTFHGIAIYMYYRDHAPPHFHAISGEDEAAFDIATGAVIAGTLPRKSRVLVESWLEQHRAELLANWALATAAQPLVPVPPMP